MEDCVVEVCVRIGAGSCAQQAFPLFATQKGDVLNHVCYALFIGLLIHTACSSIALLFRYYVEVIFVQVSGAEVSVNLSCLHTANAQ